MFLVPMIFAVIYQYWYLKRKKVNYATNLVHKRHGIDCYGCSSKLIIDPHLELQALINRKENLTLCKSCRRNYALNNVLSSAGFIKTKMLMGAIVQSLGCDYVQVSVVGKDIPHFHIHIIPRYFADEIKEISSHTSYADPEEMTSFAEKIKNVL